MNTFVPPYCKKVERKVEATIIESKYDHYRNLILAQHTFGLDRFMNQEPYYFKVKNRQRMEEYYYFPDSKIRVIVRYDLPFKPTTIGEILSITKEGTPRKFDKSVVRNIFQLMLALQFLSGLKEDDVGDVYINLAAMLGHRGRRR